MHNHHSHFVEENRSALRPVANRLLSSLPEEEQAQLADMAETIRVDVGEVLYEPGQPVRYIYFPTEALVSLLAVAEGRMTLEVGAIGREGVLGASFVLGHEVTQIRAVVQRGGRVVRIEAGAFRQAYLRMDALQRLLHRYTDIQLAQAIQIAVCSRFHVLEARLARSLLITRDRLQSDKFHLTHEFLAHALGVRRVGVTKAASALQNQKLISYSRGNIEILDAAGLEASSCRCYELVRDDGALGISQVFA